MLHDSDTMLSSEETCNLQQGDCLAGYDRTGDMTMMSWMLVGGYLRGERDTDRIGDLDTLRGGDPFPLRAGLTDLEADLETDLQAASHVTPFLPCIDCVNWLCPILETWIDTTLMCGQASHCLEWEQVGSQQATHRPDVRSISMQQILSSLIDEVASSAESIPPGLGSLRLGVQYGQSASGAWKCSIQHWYLSVCKS